MKKRINIVFDLITIFPEIFNSYFKEGIMKRAIERGIIKINVINLRNYTNDKRKTVDDTTYGGGVGMVLKVEPIYKAIKSLKIKKGRWGGGGRVILFSAKGNKFCQADARRLSNYKRIIMICGRYEGVDERVAKYIADEEISIGDFVLTGGEIPAMAVVDAVSRMIKGVVGKQKSIEEESFYKKGYKEYPHYTKPEIFSPEKRVYWKVPKVLMNGDHSKIEKWRKIQSRKKSQSSRYKINKDV